MCKTDVVAPKTTTSKNLKIFKNQPEYTKNIYLTLKAVVRNRGEEGETGGI
jgi:hypothetical protein